MHICIYVQKTKAMHIVVNKRQRVYFCMLGSRMRIAPIRRG